MKLLLLAVLVIGVSIGGAALIVDTGPQGEVGEQGIEGEQGARGLVGQRGNTGAPAAGSTQCHYAILGLIGFWADAALNLGVDWDFDAELDDFERYC